jgi:hypothetical protein
MDPRCGLRDPLDDKVKSHLRSCTANRMQCSEDRDLCTNPLWAFAAEQMVKNEDGTFEHVPPKHRDIRKQLNDSEKFIWEEFDIERVQDVKDSADYVLAYGIHRETKLPVAIKMYYSTWELTYRFRHEEYVYLVAAHYNIPHVVKLMKSYNILLKPEPLIAEKPKKKGKSKNVELDRFLKAYKGFLSAPKRSESETATFKQENSPYFKNDTRNFGELKLDEPGVSTFIALLSDLQEKLKQHYSSAYKQVLQVPETMVCVSITHLVQGESLNFHFHRKTYPLEYMKSLLFQVLFGIYALNRSGVQQNDLHPGNIMVDAQPEKPKGKEDKELIGVYHMEHKEYRITLPAKIYIFDFDLASSCDLDENTYLTETAGGGKSFCEQKGICQQRNLKFDMYTILRSLLPTYAVQAHPEIVELIETLVPQQTENAPNRFYSPKYNARKGEPTAVANIQTVIQAIYDL